MILFPLLFVLERLCKYIYHQKNNNNYVLLLGDKLSPVFKNTVLSNSQITFIYLEICHFPNFASKALYKMYYIMFLE